MLKIFNTLTKKKENFKTIYFNNINIYVCGLTVYDLCHIGNIRTLITFDIIIRYFKYLGFKVNYVRNITDIDDKIINCIVNKGILLKDFTNKMIDEMHIDLNKLGLIPPNIEPKVTNYIEEIIIFIKKLIKKKCGYIASNGDVIFSVKSYKNYGLLSRQNLLKLKNINNLNYNKLKKNHTDFVLWKISKKNEPSWPSPWGYGRPGWHIECSTIINKQFGKKIDIHGGGSDLIFPHHENEIAQSKCLNDNFCVNFWMHTGMVMLNNKKMSKSLGNFLTIRNILKYYDSETIRFFLISKHYRSPINYSEENIKQSKFGLKRLYIALNNINISNSITNRGEIFVKKFINSMNDDFNTPKACAVLFDIASEINRFKKKNKIIEAQGLATTLFYLAKILGLIKRKSNFSLNKKHEKSINKKNMIKLIKKRNIARKEKNWILADKIRNKLKKIGIIIEDKYDKTSWRID